MFLPAVSNRVDMTKLFVTDYQPYSVSIELSMALYKQNVSQIQFRQALKTISIKKWAWVATNCQKAFSFAIRRTVVHRTIFLSLVILALIPVQASGLDFKSLLRVGEQTKYRHWNMKKKKITGYTIVKLEQTVVDNQLLILVKNQNLAEDGKLFLEKKSWFESANGKLRRYYEKDARTGTEISNIFENKEINTRINTKGKVKKLTISVEQNLVPLEVLTLYLRKELPQLLKNQQLSFVLYLPIIASELARKGLPLSLSKLSMVARVESISEADTVMGRIKTVKVLVAPGSFLISTLLPRDKSEFRFTFGLQAPYYLLSFEEGVTRSELIKYKNLKQ